MSSSYGMYGLGPAQQDKYKPVQGRDFVRTPSPTPSEQRALDDDGKLHPKELLKKENWKYLAALIIASALGILMMVYHDQIVHALEPAANWMHDAPGGWLIPIAILIILSIPPLFGHEIILVLIGVTWGVGVGFAIAAAGTIIGELGTFYAFKYCLTGRAAKYEQKDVKYAVLARVIRDGGIKIAIIARYSVIPGHLLTALFSTCGMTLTTFLISATVSLPKQLVAVYLGYALKQDEGNPSTGSKAVKYITVAVTVVITILAGRYMRKRQNEVKSAVIYERRKRRQGKFELPLRTTAPGNYSPVALEEGDHDEPFVPPTNGTSMGQPYLHAPQPTFPSSSAGLVSNVRPTSPAIMPEPDMPMVAPATMQSMESLASPAPTRAPAYSTSDMTRAHTYDAPPGLASPPRVHSPAPTYHTSI